MGALHTALLRLEEKGYLKSFSGESTEDRAGRPRRYFEITALGKKSHALRERNAGAIVEGYTEGGVGISVDNKSIDNSN
jgi:DNA-binding PadR family transcriptional regulator